MSNPLTGRPKCACFEGPWPQAGDLSCDTVGDTMRSAFQIITNECRVCPTAVEFAAGASVAGILLSVAVAQLNDENGEKRWTQEEVVARCMELTGRIGDLVRARFELASKTGARN